jgi:hypothetical protein
MSVLMQLVANDPSVTVIQLLSFDEINTHANEMGSTGRSTANNSIELGLTTFPKTRFLVAKP